MKQCAYCLKELVRENFRGQYEFTRSRFCNMECYQKHHAAKLNVRKCKTCGTKIELFGKKQKAFCSRNCRYAWIRKNGRKYITPQGYVAIKVSNHPMAYSSGYILEHRYIMSQKLGRKLSVNEHVHHIDGNKQNNQPDNLALISGSEHCKVHESWKWLNTKESIEKRCITLKRNSKRILPL